MISVGDNIGTSTKPVLRQSLRPGLNLVRYGCLNVGIESNGNGRAASRPISRFVEGNIGGAATHHLGEATSVNALQPSSLLHRYEYGESARCVFARTARPVHDNLLPVPRFNLLRQGHHCENALVFLRVRSATCLWESQFAAYLRSTAIGGAARQTGLLRFCRSERLVLLRAARRVEN
jgi:hypothetical protein